MDIFNLEGFVASYRQELIWIGCGILLLSFILAVRRILLNRKASRGYEIKNGVCLLIEVPKFNEKDALAAEQMFASLHGLIKYTPEAAEHISFEIISGVEGIKFYAFVPEYFKGFVESQIYAQYPSAEIKTVEDYTLIAGQKGYAFVGCDMGFVKESFFPIKTFRDFAVDPLAAITSAMENFEEDGKIWMQFLMYPLEDGWQKEGYSYIDTVRSGKGPPKPIYVWLIDFLGRELRDFFLQFLANIFDPTASLTSQAAAAKPPGTTRLSAGQELALKAIEDKLTRLGFQAGIRIIAFARTQELAEKELSSTVAALKQFSTSNLNSIERSPIVLSPQGLLEHYIKRSFPEDIESSFILNISELASIFHLPSQSVETPTIAWVTAKKGEPPLDLPSEGSVLIGRTVFRDNDLAFGIKRDDRRHHMYIVGKTGTGKSTLMKNMFIKDIRDGEGAAFVDPHGDAIENLLDYIPEERLGDVVIFDPSDAENPVALNMLEMFNPSQKNLYASGLMDVFKKFWQDISWGPRLEHILRNCILTLLEVPNTTLLGLTRLLTDGDYQKYIVSFVKDPVIKNFWEQEIATMRQNPRLYTEAISPIQNKVGQFLSASTIRNIVGQAKSSIKIDDIIDSGKILLVNLAKGKIGEDNSAILGAMIISRLQFAAMARVVVSEEERRDFYVYVDEFQNFATSSFAAILSEARKYRLNLILGHQYISQLPDPVKEAIFGNVGTIVVFNVGPDDARFLAREFMPVFEETDLINLRKFHIYIKLMIDGMSSVPFSAVTLSPDVEKTLFKEQAISISREKFAKERVMIEERVKRWSETKFKKGMELGIPEKRITEEEEGVPESKEGESESEGGILTGRKEVFEKTEDSKTDQALEDQKVSVATPEPFSEKKAKLKEIYHR